MYLPEELKDAIYYEPKESGKESKFLERLKKLWSKKKKMNKFIFLSIIWVLFLTSCRQSKNEDAEPKEDALPDPEVEYLEENLSEDKSPLDSITIEKSENGNDFSFTIVLEYFDTTSHDISNIREGLIDGKDFWGTDGDVPAKQIKKFLLKINNERINIDPDIYKNFYNPRIDPTSMGAFWGNNSESVFVFMNGSDGAGAYSVVWSLQKNGSSSYSVNYDYLYFQFNQ